MTEHKKIPKILAIDYGTRRVGVAVSYGSLAEPLTVVPNTAQLYQDLRVLIDEHKPELLVVGLSEGEMAKQTKEFAKTLSKMVSVKLVFTDETLSSHQVHTQFREQKRRVAPGQPIDHFAAAQFLQAYIDQEALEDDGILAQ